MKKIYLIYALIFFVHALLAQGIDLQNDSRTIELVDRFRITKGLNPGFHTVLKPYKNIEVVKYAMQLDTSSELSSFDADDIKYIFQDNAEAVRDILTSNEEEGTYKPLDYYLKENTKPLLKYFYKNPAALWEINDPYFDIKINPVFNFIYSKGDKTESSLFYNTRGIDIRGSIDNKIWFYTNIFETQAKFPQYIELLKQKTGALYGTGNPKPYTSSIFNVNNGFDFLNAQGYIAFQATKHIGLQFGHGRNFIGDGYRSLLLSDVSNNYFYLKLNTRVGKFHLQNIFAELTSQDIQLGGDAILPKKYFAAHFLNYNFTPKFSLGIFETVVFGRKDQFELQYLNPVILYRSVESSLGSPDNVLVGLNARYDFKNHFSAYGQLLLDEFLFKEIVSSKGWWANKNGYQLGLKYINAFGVDHLDFQVEYNKVRPFTYSHYDSIANYTHYAQPLAHPLGANFSEYLLITNFRPIKNLNLQLRLINSKIGEDNSQNWGNNILLPNATRVSEYGNITGQGDPADIRILAFNASYALYHNIFADLHYFKRSKSGVNALEDSYIGAGLRMNIGIVKRDY
jgi:Capsule assembly protein Wzi